MATHLRDLLKSLAAFGQYGQPRTPRTLGICGPYGDPSRGGSTGYCEYYHSWASRSMSFETWLRVAELSKRYRRYCTYLTEGKPNWQVIKTIPYADNSVEVVERASDGRTRQRMVVAPSGDLCF